MPLLAAGAINVREKQLFMLVKPHEIKP